MPLYSIPQVQPWLGTEEADAVAAAVHSNWLSEGPRCAAFRDGLLGLTGAPHGVFAPNGTLALALGLMALGIGRGDEVIVPDMTFIGSANAVLMAGATPVFADVDPEYFQFDAAAAQRVVTQRTRAVMPVHLYGATCDMDAVTGFARANDLLIVEDAAQGIGVRCGGRHVGTIGDVGCFSFFADKTITTGEGGFVVCRDEGVYERLRYLRNQGRLHAGTFVHPMIGYNFRITEMQAAVGLVQLAKLQTIVERKLAAWHWYHEELGDIPELRQLTGSPHGNFVPFRCVLMAERAHDLIAFLEARGIQSRTAFYPMHRQPCFEAMEELAQPIRSDADFPNAVRGYENGLCLPAYPGLTRDEVRFIAMQIRAFYGAARD